MATAVQPVTRKKPDSFHAIFSSAGGGCSGECNYTWDSKTKQYVLVPGDSCRGPGCQPCPQTKSSAVRELVILEGCFPNPDIIGYQCGPTPPESLDAALCLYVEVLKRNKRLVKVAIGLGLLAAALLLAVIYLLAR
jgi:hypothetical protein